MIGIVDYGCGNLRSLENALETLRFPFKRVRNANEILSLEQLILPGVGHFGHAMTQLRSRGLEDAIKSRASSGLPILGICLGMQLLFESSEEAPNTPGLAFLKGRFQAFPKTVLKVPHMGWSTVDFGENRGTGYFVHSYRLPDWVDERPTDVLGITQYSGPFVAAFRSGNLAGFQFHPEKSGSWGLGLLMEALTWS